MRKPLTPNGARGFLLGEASRQAEDLSRPDQSNGTSCLSGTPPSTT
jgi:hypothetical protein